MNMRNMRKYMILPLALITLCMTISAEEENVLIDPYKVTFDLNVTSNYTIGVTPAEVKETYAGESYTSRIIVISDIEGNGWEPDAKIEIAHFTGAAISKADLEKELRSTESLIDMEFYNRTIDNAEGLLMIASFMGTNVFQFMYLPDANTLVMVDSRIPWDEGTLNLLKTIHVEKLDR